VKTFIATLVGTTRYSQSKYVTSPQSAGESDDDYDLRTVKEHLHTDDDGNVLITPSTIKNCIDEAAKFLSIKMPGGGGKATFTKHFEAGVAIFEPMSLGIHKDDVPYEVLFLNPQGRRGGGTRVPRRYPYIAAGWKIDATIVVLDETVLHSYPDNPNETVFEHVLKAAGTYIGIGRWRPRNRGYYGRFKVENLVEVKDELLMAAE
jgi:hypothetical protein